MSMSIARRLSPASARGDLLFSWYRFVKNHRRLPRKNARLINDRLYRMKIDGTLLDPLRQFVTDKEFVKIYVAGTVGDNYNIETFKVLRRPSEIEAYIPHRFPCVVKPTHLSGSVMICYSSDSYPEAELLKRWMERSHYKRVREQNYRHLEPKIMIEEFISDDHTRTPNDYKIYCFYGVPKYIHVDTDRFENHTRNFYDTEWRRLDVEWAYPSRSCDDAKPEALDEMLRVASALSAPFDFIRVDLYAIDGKVRVGEMTNCPDGGGGEIKPIEMEGKLYRW